MMLRLQGTSRTRRIGIEMILRLVSERFTLVIRLYAIAAGNGVSDKLNAPVRQYRRLSQAASLVYIKSFEHRLQLIAFQDIHHPCAVYPLRQALGKRQDGVFLRKTDAVGQLVVYLHHEISTPRFGLHPEGSPLKVRENTHTWIGERHCPGDAMTDTSHIDNACIIGRDKGRALGLRCSPCRSTGKQGKG